MLDRLHLEGAQIGLAHWDQHNRAANQKYVQLAQTQQTTGNSDTLSDSGAPNAVIGDPGQTQVAQNTPGSDLDAIDAAPGGKNFTTATGDPTDVPPPTNTLPSVNAADNNPPSKGLPAPPINKSDYVLIKNPRGKDFLIYPGWVNMPRIDAGEGCDVTNNMMTCTTAAGRIFTIPVPPGFPSSMRPGQQNYHSYSYAVGPRYFFTGTIDIWGHQQTYAHTTCGSGNTWWNG